MSASGYTPILLYASGTATNVPLAANLTSSASGAELALNYADGKLYYKNSSGVVTLLASSSGSPAGGSNTQVQYNSSGVLAGSANMTFNGTSLTLGGNPTLSAGTANGITYLNGSKVLTTGSALTFDGTNLSVGVATPQGRVHSQVTTPSTLALSTPIYYGGDGSKQFQLLQTGATYNTAGAGGNELWYYTASYAALTFGSDGNIPIKWVSNGSEQMRLTSTGLGIGTSSPAYKLDVTGTANITGIITASATGGFFANNGATTSGKYISIANTGGTAQIGVESSAGGTQIVGSSAYMTAITGKVGIGFSGNDGAALHMTLNTSGNLGIGTSSPSQKLVVSNGGAEGLEISPNAIASGPALISYNRSGAGYTPLTAAALRHVWQNSGTEAMRLDSTGLGIGTSSPAAKLNVVGADAAIVGLIAGATNGIRIIPKASSAEVAATDKTGSASYQQLDLNGSLLTFLTSGTERMRLDSSGNLLVGTTSSTPYPTQGLSIYGNNGGSALIGMGHVTGTASGNAYMTFAYNGTGIGSITQSGTTAVLYNVTSDQRLKENIQDADDAASLIDSLQVRKFDWKTDNTHQRYGFVAQELVTVAPEAVHQPANEEDMMAVDYSKLVPMLVKEIQSLRQRLAALEAK